MSHKADAHWSLAASLAFNTTAYAPAPSLPSAWNLCCITQAMPPLVACTAPGAGRQARCVWVALACSERPPLVMRELNAAVKRKSNANVLKT